MSFCDDCKPLVDNVVQPVVAIVGAGSIVPSNVIVPKLASLVPNQDGTIRTNNLIFSRASTAHVPDGDNLYKQCAVDELRIWGARRVSEGVWSWKTSSGIPLRPVTSYKGQLIFDTYSIRQNSTAYGVGDRIYYYVNGLGYWAECTVSTGNSAASQPAMPTVSGATVVDGNVTWKYGGLYRIKGVLLEPSRTNLNGYTQDHQNQVGAIARATITPNSTTSPTGANDAYLLNDSNAGGTGTVIPISLTTTVSGQHTFSVFLKAGASTVVRLATSFFSAGETYGQVEFNLSAGTLNIFTAGTGQGMEPVGDGWYRCWITGTANVGDTTGDFRLYIYDKDTNGITCNIDGTNTIYMWHPQIEAGSYPTMPIATIGGVTATRQSEINALSLPYGSNGFSQEVGTVLIEWIPVAPVAEQRGVISVEQNIRASLAYTNGAAAIVNYDGTNILSRVLNNFGMNVNKSVRIGWGSGDKWISLKEETGVESIVNGAFDGNWELNGGDSYYLGSQAVGADCFLNLVAFDKDLYNEFV